jgi:hypothetical protein
MPVERVNVIRRKIDRGHGESKHGPGIGRDDADLKGLAQGQRDVYVDRTGASHTLPARRTPRCLVCFDTRLFATSKIQAITSPQCA